MFGSERFNRLLITLHVIDLTLMSGGGVTGEKAARLNSLKSLESFSSCVCADKKPDMFNGNLDICDLVGYRRLIFQITFSSKSYLGEVADHSLVGDFFPAQVLDIEGSYLHCDSCSNCGGTKKKREETQTDEVMCGKVRN